MAVDAPSGIVKWYSHNLVGPRFLTVLRASLTGKKQPDGSQETSYVRLSDKEVDELIENIKKDPEGFPVFDEANAPDKREEYQKWLVARYHTKPKEEAFDNTQKEPEPTPSASKPISSDIVPVGTRGTDLVEEEIDPQILAILGLQDVFDLTYEEYSSLLKEASIKGRMNGSQMTTESVELITNEYKRVKGKTGAFKVKQKKINIDKVMNRRAPSPQRVELDPKKLLPPGIESTTPKTDLNNKIVKFLNEDLVDELDGIGDKLDELLSSIKSEDVAEKKEKEKKRRKAEVDKKKKRETELESGSKKANAIFDKVAKPFVNFFDRIKQFFLSILLGSALNFLLSVFKNPGIILNPLKSLANSIVGFLNNIISFLWNFFVSPINFVINSINSGISGLIGQINNAIRLIPGANPINAPQIPTIPGPPQIPTPFPVQQQVGGGQVVPTPFPVQQQEGGGAVINVGDISFEGGGQINKKSGIKISGFGKDDRLIAAQSGEVMMSNKAGDFFGRDNLLAMNAMAGGTNKPKFGKMGIAAMQGGGQVGMKGGVMGGGNPSPIVKLVQPYGTPGATGSSGSSGTPGATGSSGSSGTPGATGSSGSSGTPGATGLMGATGATGMSGMSGATGATGMSGMSGAAGPTINVKVTPPPTSTSNKIPAGYGLGSVDVKSTLILDTLFNRPQGTTAAQIAEKKLSTSIPTPPRKGGVVPLPIPIGGGPSKNSIPTSSAAPNQGEIPSFSSEDPNNMTTLVVKAIYNVVG